MSDNPFKGPWARVPGGTKIVGDSPFEIGSVYDLTDNEGKQFVGRYEGEAPSFSRYPVFMFRSGDDTLFIGQDRISSYRYVGNDRTPGGKPITGNNPESCQSSVVAEKDRDIQTASIVDDVIDDLKYRREVGKRKYGRELLSDVPCANGKSALENLYEELLDAVLYLKKALEEK